MQRALKETGFAFRCTEACNAETASALTREEKFDPASLNYFLPDQDGLTLLKQLRHSGMNSPIIMLTDQGNENVVIDLMKAGTADYWNNADITAERLKRRIRSALRVHEATLPYIPILLITAHDASSMVKGLDDGGADDFLRKPLSVGELSARVRSLLRLKHTSTALIPRPSSLPRGRTSSLV